MKLTRNLIKYSFAAPLALALAACGGSEEETLTSDAIAAIPAPDGSSWNEVVNVSEDGLGYIVGNPDAPVKLVEYASHTCGACAMFSVSAKDSLKNDYIASGVVSFEQREIFLNTFDVVIAALAQCGSAERFQPLSDEVWGNLQAVMQGIQSNQAGVQAASQLTGGDQMLALGNATGLIEFFQARGLSKDQAEACLTDSDKIQALVDGNSEKAQELNIVSTPTFVLNGNVVDAKQWPGVEPLLQRAGARPVE